NTPADADGPGGTCYQGGGGGGNGGGATGTTYTLGDADVGDTLEVVAGDTDGHGTPERGARGANARVGNLHDGPAGTGATGGSATGSTWSAPPAPPTRWAMPMSGTPSMWWRATPTAMARRRAWPVRRPHWWATSTMRRPAR